MALEKISEITEITTEHENAINKIVEILSLASNRVDLYVDSDNLNMLLANNIIKKTCVRLRSKGIQIRCISEISKENSSLVRKIVDIVDDFNHLDGISGSFIVTNAYCIIGHTTASKQPKTQIIVSSVNTLVKQHQQLFETMWDKSIPASEKIKEIQEERIPEITETIRDPVKGLNRCWEMIKNAKEEVLAIFSTANGFSRQEKIGSVQLAKEMCTKRKDLQVRLLAPKSEHIEEVRSELRNQHYNIDIKFIQEFSQTKISMIIVDRKSSMVVEVKNDDAVNTLDAMGQSTYSTRILTVLSYVSIFESYWTLSQLYEESENELAYTKEYLDKVLTEMDISKK